MPRKTTPKLPASQSLRRTLIFGTAWMVMMRWAIRGIGLISTIILVRILAPTDFGLIAMASLTVGMAEVLLSFGVDMALIQRQSRSREDFDSAWTLRVLQGTVAAIVVVAATPTAVRYFNEPRLEAVLWALSAGIVCGSFSNIGTVLFRTELEFGKEFRFEVLKKILAFAITISAAFVLKSYWALVIGTVAGAISGTMFSYWVHPYRPRFSTVSIPKLWSVSQWMLVTNVGFYAESRADELIIGGNMSSREMGFYSIGSEIAQLPTSEIAQPISRTLVPGYSRLQHDADRLNAAFLNAFGMLFLVAVPAGTGLCLVAKNAVAIMLGAKWNEVTPIVQILAVHGVIRIAYGAIGNLFVATGRVRLVAGLTWVGMVLFVGGAGLAVGPYGLIGVALTKVTINLAMFLVALEYLWLVRRISLGQILARIYRPATGAAMMVAGLTVLPSGIFGHVSLELAAQILGGALIYVVVVLTLWLVGGRPDGAESFFAERIRAARRKSS